MSLTKAQANSNTQTTQTDLQTSANALFIANADAAIASAITFGQFQITVTTLPNVNIKTVFQYYVNLGYQVFFPDAQTNFADNPSQLFGFFYEAYWNDAIGYLHLHNPVRMTINWGNYEIFNPFEDNAP